jgi:putative ubiquitin-RnfH superfamily antitoxin RatB of RatAB toxin-antitoxin module
LSIEVELTAAWPDRAIRARLTLPQPLPIEALGPFLPSTDSWQEAWASRSGVAREGRALESTDLVRHGDQLVLLRPLLADPKQARQQRVEAQRAAKAAAGAPDRWTKNR